MDAKAKVITAIAVAVSCYYVEIMLCGFNVIKHARLIKMVYVTKHDNHFL